MCSWSWFPNHFAAFKHRFSSTPDFHANAAFQFARHGLVILFITTGTTGYPIGKQIKMHLLECVLHLPCNVFNPVLPSTITLTSPRSLSVPKALNFNTFAAMLPLGNFQTSMRLPSCKLSRTDFTG